MFVYYRIKTRKLVTIQIPNENLKEIRIVRGIRINNDGKDKIK